MRRARSLSRLANENVFSVDASNNVGINSTTPDARLDVVGVVSATSFFGDGTGLTGVASTENIITGTAATFTGGINAAQSDVSVRNLTGVAATFTGVLTYEDVTSIDSLGIVTARTGIDVLAGGINAVGVVTASQFDGSITGTAATIGSATTITAGGVNVTGVVTATSFTGSGANLTNLNIPAAFNELDSALFN